MNVPQALLARYRSHLSLPWPTYLSATERVWIAVYDPSEERRVRATLGEFALATDALGITWAQVDLTAAFAEWIGAHPYRDAYFHEPHLLGSALVDFEDALQARLTATLGSVPERSVVGVVGAGALLGLTRISRVIERAAPHLRGRMLLLFPGSLDGHNYRLLNARDGWNYHSVPLLP